MTPSVAPRRLVLLGHPVAHSLSPLMQEAALRSRGIEATYEALDVPVAQLADLLATLVERGDAGNVTIPHKRQVAAACDRRTAVAERAGAVNTFWVSDGLLHGDNTDVAGFDAAVAAAGVSCAGARVALLGAGGAAAAVCTACEGWPGAEVKVWARRRGEAERLAAGFPTASVVGDKNAAVRDATLVVNATPIGMTDDALPFAIELLPCDAVVMDLVYRREQTALVQAARARGHRALDGREMLVWQGAWAFQRWFGILPDVGAMRAALDGRG